MDTPLGLSMFVLAPAWTTCGCVDFAAAVGSPLVNGPMYAPTGQARLLDPPQRAAGIPLSARCPTSRTSVP